MNFLSENLSKNYVINVILGTALLSLASKISFHIGLIPITLQTFAVYFLGLFLRPRESFSVGISWIALGLSGAPVFSSSFVSIVSYTAFGYIIGMVIGMPLMKLLFNKFKSVLLSCVLCYGIVSLFGCVWLYTFVHDWKTAFAAGLLPFIFVDSCKIAAVSVIYRVFKRN